MASTALVKSLHKSVEEGSQGQIFGDSYYVDSGSGSDSNAGKTPANAMATIDAAIALCTANQGDVIYVMPGHAESISAAAGINMDIAGVSIVGVGQGADRPTVTMTATVTTVAIGAASCRIKNIIFTTSAIVVMMIDVNDTDFTIEDCEFVMLTAETAINVDGGSGNACDRLQVLRCVFDGSTDGPNEAIMLDEVADSVVIDGCYAYGLFDDACIHNPTGSELTWLRITNCVLLNTTASSHSIELVSASTGVIAANLCGSPLGNTAATDIDGGATHMAENYSHDASGNTSAKLNPTVVV